MRAFRVSLLFFALGCSESTPAAEAIPEVPELEEPSVAQPAPRRRPPPPDIWVLRSDETLRAEIQRALARARERDTRVLLEFGADWCPDCNEVARLGEVSPCKEVIEEHYERVYVHVGRVDRHRDLLDRYRIDRIATLVILEKDGRRAAQTTLEPITGGQTGLTAEALATWLRNPQDQWRRPDPPTGSPPPDDSPIFPADVIDG